MLTTPTRYSALVAHIRSSWRILLKEITAFGAVGAVGFAIDVGLFNLLLHHGVGVLTSKCVSTVVATAFTYVGNRYLSFSHRARIGIARETSFFFGINLIALIMAELILGFFAYPLGYKHDRLVMNVVNLFTIALGTLFRFWAYKRFVFLHPDRVHSPEVDLDEELAES